jgi:hypothetical protein
MINFIIGPAKFDQYSVSRSLCLNFCFLKKLLIVVVSKRLTPSGAWGDKHKQLLFISYGQTQRFVIRWRKTDVRPFCSDSPAQVRPAEYI